jgi:hypothetical protein
LNKSTLRRRVALQLPDFAEGILTAREGVFIAVQAGECGLTASWEDPLTGQASTSDDAFQGWLGRTTTPTDTPDEVAIARLGSPVLGY